MSFNPPFGIQIFFSGGTERRDYPENARDEFLWLATIKCQSLVDLHLLQKGKWIYNIILSRRPHIFPGLGAAWARYAL